ncbi:deoxyadenosine kinase [Acidihalobacter aeolianus]|uniref:Deoxyadenosine kinase n=1 Tax=Acidihalobacter aeolianus TaxID=2792603 RepID=A0A1D8K6I9_9GAMM|nr:deoxynucleoside kinase [Acidihalobacter aeolianus]AOV16585.1 deoxyadenosine kinase [Acidihalobacter aeolianus]
MTDLPAFIAIEGPIGVGKTTLARRLSEDFGASLLLEQPEENPFLERFYENPRAVALPTQLSFLMTRVRQMRELRQNDLFTSTRIADFVLEKDRLFAEVTLDSDELELYEQVYVQLSLDAPRPDLVVYLQAPVDVLLRRIERRARNYERMIEAAYLSRLCSRYTDYFYHYDASPLLIVNASEIDIVNNEKDYQALVDEIRSPPSGRRYFNPLPFTM